MLVNQFLNKFPKKVSFSWFMARRGDVYRDIDGRQTMRFDEQGESYFIKIHTGVGWKEIFKNLSQFKWPVLGAKNEYLAIKRLTDLDIDTMTLVSYETRGWNPAELQSYVVTEELKDTVSLEDYCANWLIKPPTYQEKRALINKVAGITKKIHENGINHRDYYICHFLMKKKQVFVSDMHLFLIDLHRVQIRNKVPERWLVKDLAALYFSAMHIGLTKRDLFRFIKTYQSQTLRYSFNHDVQFWKKVEDKARILNGMPESKKKR